MPRNSPRLLLPFLCALCLSAFSQENTIVRIGIALPATAAQDVSEVEIRDRLVKAVNEANRDKKRKMSLQAIALASPPGGRALAEAKGSDCTFVLYARLRPIENAQEYEPSYTGTVVETRAQMRATVEYLVRRVAEGVPYAAGTAKSEQLMSSREAVFQAVERLGNELIGDLEKGGNATASSLAESETLEKLAPTLNRDVYSGAHFCDWLPADIAHADALRGVCEYAMTLPQKMPNFICHQETSRFQGRDKVPADLITANVRYENGDESYSDLKVNGKPVPEASARGVGLWSSGQFEGNLRDIFHSGNHAAFEFSGENQAGGHAAWVFRYSISQQNEPLWQLRAEDKILAPPYSGELWVDQKTGEVLRFRSAAKNLPSSFPMQSAEVIIDYDNVAFGDGTAFVLPVNSSVATRFQGFEPTRNVVQFRGCHRFHATARMIFAEGPGGKTPGAAGAADLQKSELEENETILAILSEQAMRESARQLEIEQEQDLKWATVRAMSRLAALERERQRNIEAETASATTSSTTRVDTPALTYKVSVNLVPVSVVVRDAKGNAVGNLRKSDFQLFDERKPQPIGSFSVEKTASEPLAGSPTAGTAFTGSDQKTATENNVAYIFDDLHSSYEDIENARDAAMRHLAEMRPNDRAAVFTTSGEVGLDFTADHDQLKAALRRLKPHAAASQADCPPMTYYEADLIVNQYDRAAVELALKDTLDCTFDNESVHSEAEMEKARQLATAKAFERLQQGRVDTEQALYILDTVISRTATVPGRRSIVVVSPGFLAIAPAAQDGVMALTERALQAGIVVSTLDVTGLATPSVASNRSHINEPMESARLGSGETVARNAVLADLAYGTGGTFFHNNNDLDQGFRQTAGVPEYIYVLGFSPEKLDGKFHKLKVKLANGQKLTVQARAGYLARKRASAQ